MAHKHSVRDMGAHYTIDQYTRQIKNDSVNKTTIVQYDHNSERLTFEMPLYVDGHAMTLCDLIEIHYINISTDGNSQNHGTYEVNDIKAEGEKAVFTWLISQECTQLAGSLNFFVVFKCTESGVTVYRWGTEIYKNLPISAGMDNGEAIVTEYPDILAQWKAQIFGASDNAVLAVETAKTSALAAIEAAGEAKKQSVLDSIPDEYEALSALADQNHRNKAGAIVLDAEGESIVVNDASEYPLQNLKLFGKSEQIKTTGKNLFNPENVVNGYPYNISGLFVANSANRTGYVLCEPNTTYTVSKKVGSRFALAYTTQIPADGVSVHGMVTGYDSESLTITTGSNAVYLIVWVYNGNVDTITAEEMIDTVQVEKGDKATNYEPYTGGVASPSPEWAQEINSMEEPEIAVRGKNLIPQLSAYSKYGITITENNDGTSTLNGTATNSLGYKSKSVYLPSGTYTLKCNHVLDAETWLSISNTPLMIFPGEQQKTFTLEGGEHWLYFYVNTGVTFDNYVLEAQLEVGESATDFEPYTEQAINIPHTIPGIPVSSGGNYTDENGQEWICDEVDLARGVYVQRVGAYTNDGTTSTWGINQVNDTTIIFLTQTPCRPIEATKQFFNMQDFNWTISLSSRQNSGAVGTSGILYCICSVADFPDVDSFKAHLNVTPLECVYPLATPIETALSDAEITAFKALHSNRPNTVILNDAGAHMAVSYVADTKTYIDNKFAEMMEGVTG